MTFLCMYKTCCFYVFLFMHVFYFLETCKIKPVCFSQIALLHSFIALFSCILTVSGWGGFLSCLYTHNFVNTVTTEQRQ